MGKPQHILKLAATSVWVLAFSATSIEADTCASPCEVEAAAGGLGPMLQLVDLTAGANTWEINTGDDGETLSIVGDSDSKLRIHDGAGTSQLVLDPNGNTAFNNFQAQSANEVEVYAKGDPIAAVAITPSNNSDESARMRVNLDADTFAVAVRAAGEGTYDRAFEVHLGAGPNSLTVDSDGDVAVGGIGTANIEGDFHIAGGQVYLDPSGSDFDWQVNPGGIGLWFVHEDANPSTPFKIQNGASDDQLVVDFSGVGIGTATPSDDLDVFSGSPTIALTDVDLFGGGVNRIWELNSNSQASIFDLRDVTAGVSPLVVHADAVDEAVVIDTDGVSLSSSRSVKRDIEPLASAEVLSLLADLPLYSWKYQSDPSEALHVGPMAEDFHRLFGLGKSDRRISSIDTAGVALAAIQALHENLEKKDAEIAELRAVVDLLLAERRSSAVSTD